MTKTGELFGTPMYMSPEQCAGNNTDLRSDIYSLGACMYECLNGAPPPVGDNVLQTMFRRASEDAPPLSKVRPDLKITPEVEQVVMRAIRRDPDDRYQSMSGLKKALAPFAMNAYSSSTRQTPTSTRAIERPRSKAFVPARASAVDQFNQTFSPRSLRIALICASFIFLGLCAGMIYFLNHDSNSATSSSKSNVGQKPAVLESLMDEGLALLRAKQYLSAEPKLREALNVLKKSDNPTNQKSLNVYDWLGQVYIGTSSFSDAEDCTRQAIELANSLYQRETVRVLTLRLGMTLIYSNKFKEAIPVLQSTVDMSQMNLNGKILALDSLAFAYLNLKEYDDCSKTCKEVVSAIANTTDKDLQYYLANAYLRIARAEVTRKKYDLARPDAEKALKIYQSLAPETGKAGIELAKDCLREISSSMKAN